MATLKILIGVPGAGKSTWRKTQTAKTFSSDDYRKELLGDLHQDKNSDVFKKLNEDTFAHLKAGQDAIYDATNISRKKRMSLYREAKRIGVKVEAVHFLVPLKTALERNSQREGLARVPDDVIVKMYKGLQVARKGVDCDEISVIGKMEVAWESFDVPHNNPYHEESIKEHIEKVIENSKTEKEKEVALWHDVGKIECLVENNRDTEAAKFFRDKNGGKFYQFMDHANVSAQYYLSHIQDDLSDRNLENLEHILLHDTVLSDKTKRNFNLSDDFVAFHKRFRELDESGMRPSPYLKDYLKIIEKNAPDKTKAVKEQTVFPPQPVSNQMFHINSNGEVRPCKAQIKQCKFQKHFKDFNQALKVADILNEKGVFK